MAFPTNESYFRENPNYVTSWLTHGLLEASASLPLNVTATVTVTSPYPNPHLNAKTLAQILAIKHFS